MKQPLGPTWVSVILVAFVVLAAAMLPISIDIHSNVSSAQSDAVEFTLRTVLGQTPPMAFQGVGGDIDGIINPELRVNVGDTVTIRVINGDPVAHDLVVDAFGVSTGQLVAKDEVGVVTFTVTEAGTFEYYCSLPGHRDIGMVGNIVVVDATATPDVEAEAAVGASIIHDPADIPAPVGDRGPITHDIELTAIEVTGQLADGTTYDYFTFDGTVPGPMLRVRVDDTINMTIHNADGSLFPHSIDLHAVTGPGGGAVFTQTNPGESTQFSFKALRPGLYVYHCATPSVAHHITSGMYGLILVEPAGGLPPVDREFYVMQGEMYTTEPYGTEGHLTFDHAKMLDEDAEYFTFNGAANALMSDAHALHANVGETVRIYFGVGGPNATSSFHVIGEIFDRVFNQASLTSEPLTDVQTTTVAPGGATMVEFTVDVPGRYILVDHALSRMERGLAGYLYVDGPEDLSIISGEVTEGSGH